MHKVTYPGFLFNKQLTLIFPDDPDGEILFISGYGEMLTMTPTQGYNLLKALRGLYKDNPEYSETLVEKFA